MRSGIYPFAPNPTTPIPPVSDAYDFRLIRQKLLRGRVQCFLQGHLHRLLGVAGLGPWTTPPHPIVYVADLAEIVAEHSTSFHAYADDNQLYIHCQPKGAQTAVESTQRTPVRLSNRPGS